MNAEAKTLLLQRPSAMGTCVLMHVRETRKNGMRRTSGRGTNTWNGNRRNVFVTKSYTIFGNTFAAKSKDWNKSARNRQAIEIVFRTIRFFSAPPYLYCTAYPVIQLIRNIALHSAVVWSLCRKMLNFKWARRHRRKTAITSMASETPLPVTDMDIVTIHHWRGYAYMYARTRRRRWRRGHSSHVIEYFGCVRTGASRATRLLTLN